MIPVRPNKCNPIERSNGGTEFSRLEKTQSEARRDPAERSLKSGEAGFSCQRCGSCCRWGGYVYITDEDVIKMSRYLKLTESEFVNRYAEIIHKPRLCLKTKPDGGCVFLTGNDCAIYPARPGQCAGFPETWRIKDLESFCCGQKRAVERAAERP